MVLHHEHFYRDMADPVALFKRNKSTELSSYWSYAGSAVTTDKAQAAATYSQLMADTQPMVAAQVLAAFSFATTRKMLDLGGGTGAFLSAVRMRYKHIDATVYDLPAVVESTIKPLQQDDDANFPDGENLTQDDELHEKPVQFTTGDFFKDPLPDTYDTISLVRILHDHNTEAVTKLLVKIYHALPTGGTLVIAEPMADTSHAERVGAVYFNCYFLAMNQGEPRSIHTVEQLLLKAGFSEVTHHPTPLPLVCSVISAVK